jgi:subtilase-type serine protease
VKSILLATATDMGAPGVDEIYGHGKLDLRNALSPQGDLSTSPTAF